MKEKFEKMNVCVMCIAQLVFKLTLASAILCIIWLLLQCVQYQYNLRVQSISQLQHNLKLSIIYNAVVCNMANLLLSNCNL